MEIITVRSDQQTATRQNLRNFVGISEKTAGAKGLSLNLVIVPPGGKAEPHYHDGFETAIYVLQGRVETKYGNRLEKSVINGPGDFVFIPADLPHQAINLSDTEEARAIIARNDPNEQESVVPWKIEE